MNRAFIIYTAFVIERTFFHSLIILLYFQQEHFH